MKKLFLLVSALAFVFHLEAKAQTPVAVVEYESFFYDLSNTYADVVLCLYADQDCTTPLYASSSVFVNLRRITYYGGSGHYTFHNGTSTEYPQYEALNPRLTISSAELLDDGSDTIRYWADGGTGYTTTLKQWDNNAW